MTNICKILLVCRATSLLVSDVSLLNLKSLQNKFKTLFSAVSTNICERGFFKVQRSPGRVCSLLHRRSVCNAHVNVCRRFFWGNLLTFLFIEWYIGVGALYIRRKPRVRVEPIQSGGGQERYVPLAPFPSVRQILHLKQGLVKLQNTRPLFCISLNDKSAYCVIPRSLKSSDKCKWFGRVWSCSQCFSVTSKCISEKLTSFLPLKVFKFTWV